MTNLAFFELCQKHGLQDETEVWAKATELSDSGDKALLAYLLDTDVETQLAKVFKATNAQEQVRRSKLSRVALLEEYFAKRSCSCDTPGLCYDLLKEVLRTNNLDGPFQQVVFGALQAGRAKMRNVCLLGPPDAAKSFLLKGLGEVYACYRRPDGGSYQLEDLLGKEVVFLNDFEYDAGAKEWMPWSYFKNFLEGGVVTVARPKNRGGNVVFKATAPVFLTAPEEVKLFQRGREVVQETAQMRKRIHYLHLTRPIPEDQRKEVLQHCGHCSARLYLEGKASFQRPFPFQQQPSPLPRSPLVPDERREPGAKKRRTVQDCLQELQDLKQLLDAGVLSQREFSDLKERLLKGD